AGDIFQVVLSRTFEAPFKAAPFDIYRAMRLVSPSPFMFYLDLGDAVIVGASPEKLVSLDDGVLESCPLAGTRPRGNGKADHDLEADLLSDEKEKAEHMMLVDLARNDLGALSRAGSVKVNELMQVQKFSHVMHISSTVEGQIADDKDAFDALRMTLPAGTLSGAPKIRAMEIIDELEISRRGVYGGTVCAIDHDGNLNSCIIIRTAVLRDGVAQVRAGAGIVYDSDPASEAMETRHKTRGVFEALRLAEGGLI
ncbi:MAG: anthranilate synthase component I family protein, partial [Sphingomonadales bacterium]|nr:anthranilate synthase component I family protein [Sphingomonadales bacterium]